MKAVKTNTIKAKYAELPVVSTEIRFMVQIVEPVEMVPTLVTFSHGDIDSRVSLENKILDDWHKDFNDSAQSPEAYWLSEVDNVELIECNLLTPK